MGSCGPAATPKAAKEATGPIPYHSSGEEIIPNYFINTAENTQDISYHTLPKFSSLQQSYQNNNQIQSYQRTGGYQKSPSHYTPVVNYHLPYSFQMPVVPQAEPSGPRAKSRPVFGRK